MKTVIHLLPNAHLDPVWLWDWREGLNEGITTVRAVLDLMDEAPDLTFIRGESAIYRHIEKTDPRTFRRILKRIEEGRWDVVGGTLIQPDTNLASTETLCREYEIGLEYFEKHVGVRPRIAWQADSFGHTAGLPNIFSAFGMEGFCFTRPNRSAFPMESPAFWWEGTHGNRVLCYRPYWIWYGTERQKVYDSLNETLAGARRGGLTHVGLPLGLGNHGGGPTRKHLFHIQEWGKENPEVEVVYSTFTRFFQTLRSEAEKKKAIVPVHRGEFGFCLRGCYSSVQKFKSLFRRGEAAVAQAEITRSVIGAATGTPGADLAEAWTALAFNAFHDILPGSSIERAFEDQTAWTGLALHRAEEVKFEALNRLTARIDTRVIPPVDYDAPFDVPFVVWNPSPQPFTGLVELEAALDYRPLWDFYGKPDQLPLVVAGPDNEAMPFQEIATENISMVEVPWRKRVLVPVTIPSFGWTFATLGWRDVPEPVKPVGKCRASDKGAEITNGDWRIKAEEGRVVVQRGGKNFFGGARHLGLVVVEDPWGSWGGMNEEKDSYLLENVRETWKLEQAHVLERGPLRARLWTLWRGKNSWAALTFAVQDGSPVVAVETRLLWNERSARLKLILPSAGPVRYDVPAGEVVRDVKGQVPGGNWAVRGEVGFASDSLSDFDAGDDELRVTLARASRYASDVPTSPTDKPWQPSVDCGELKFHLRLFGPDSVPDHVAATLLAPPTPVIALGTKGEWKRRGSLGGLNSPSLRLLTLEQIAPRRLKVRVQNRSKKAVPAVLTLAGARIALGRFGPGEIVTSHLVRIGKTWKPVGQARD